jgi:hypothetical protein
MADVIGEVQCKPVMIYGRSPSGVLAAATTDGNGNLNVSGSTSTVDTIVNTVPTPIMIYGRAAGVLTAVTTDGTGKLS